MGRGWWLGGWVSEGDGGGGGRGRGSEGGGVRNPPQVKKTFNRTVNIFFVNQCLGLPPHAKLTLRNDRRTDRWGLPPPPEAPLAIRTASFNIKQSLSENLFHHLWTSRAVNRFIY